MEVQDLTAAQMEDLELIVAEMVQVILIVALITEEVSLEFFDVDRLLSMMFLTGPYCCANGANNPDCCANGGSGPDCCTNGGFGSFCCRNGANNPDCCANNGRGEINFFSNFQLKPNQFYSGHLRAILLHKWSQQPKLWTSDTTAPNNTKANHNSTKHIFATRR